MSGRSPPSLPEHPSFADLGNLPPPSGPARACNFGDNPLTPANDPFAGKYKLIGGAGLPGTTIVKSEVTVGRTAG